MSWKPHFLCGSFHFQSFAADLKQHRSHSFIHAVYLCTTQVFPVNFIIFPMPLRSSSAKLYFYPRLFDAKTQSIPFRWCNSSLRLMHTLYGRLVSLARLQCQLFALFSFIFQKKKINNKTETQIPINARCT